MPDDSALFVYGVNHAGYDPVKHHILSAASCTTTGLAHMIKPLLDTEETSRIITASMSTVHAATNNQNILDASPKAGSKDLRRNRSVFNNIIPTSTGAANSVGRNTARNQKSRVYGRFCQGTLQVQSPLFP